MSDQVDFAWPDVLESLIAGRDLDGAVARHAMDLILRGEATQAQIAAYVLGLRGKSSAIAELVGMVRAMQDAATPLSIPDDAIDIVGVGGGRSRREHALNVSTMACFVAAGAGATVCKHGNRKASSTSGSFDLLEVLGVTVEMGPDELSACVREVGVGFAFARAFHQAMRHAAPVRAELGIATVFNILGPLAHPARIKRQVVGVAEAAMGEKMASVLRANGAERALVVSGHPEVDELSITGSSQVVELRDGAITTSELDPTTLGISLASPDELRGGDAAANAEILERVFGGERGPYRDMVALNAGAGLVVAGLADDLGAGLQLAYESIDSGAAAAKLADLVARCQEQQ